MPDSFKQLKDRAKRIGSSKGKGILSSRKKDLTAKQVYQIAKKRTFPSVAQWQELPRLLSKGERKIFGVSTAIAVIALVTLLFGIFFTNRIVVPAVGGDYTEGLVGEPQFLNPILAPTSTVDMDISRLLFRGLFIIDPTIGLVPDIARGFEISEDEKTYTVFLRDDVKWHDGQMLTANDVAFTFQAISNPEYKSPLGSSFRDITLDIVDDYTVTFTLSEPFAPFLSSLTIGLLPAHVWEAVAPARASLTSLNLQPVGNGPYKFEKFTKDQSGVIRSYTLERSRTFYGESPKLKNITFKFYPDVDSAIEALSNRNIEGVGFIPEELTGDFEDRRLVSLIRPNIPQQTIAFFNEKRNPILEVDAVREAMNIAINRDEIVEEVFNNHATPIYGPLLPNTFGESPEPIMQDMDRAESLLDDAKWLRDATTQVRQKDINDDDEPDQLAFELVTVQTPDMIAVAEHLKRAWEAMGARIEIRVVDQRAFGSDVLKPRAYDILLTGVLFGADPDPFPFWHSSQVNDPGVNLAQYSNRNVDTALEEARATVDPAKRDESYTKFQTLVLDDLPAIFLLQPTYAYATSSKIQGIELGKIVIPADRFNRIEEWYIKTKKVFKPGGSK